LQTVSVWQIALAVLAVLKLRSGIQDQATSTAPPYNESHMSVPPAVTSDYTQQDAQFAPQPFSSTSSKPTASKPTEPPAY